MRVAFYIVSAILVGLIAAGFIYTFNFRMERIEQREQRRTSLPDADCIAGRCAFRA